MSLPISIPRLADIPLYEVLRNIITKAIDGTRKPLFVDENNQRVGVGTVTPRSAVKLDVTGGDIGTSDAGAGLNVKTPDGSKTFRIFVDNDGIVSSVQLTMLALCLFASSASAQVGSSNTYLSRQATQTVTGDKLFTVLHSSEIGGRTDSNGVNFSSRVVINGDLIITGAIVPSTAVATAAIASATTTIANNLATSTTAIAASTTTLAAGSTHVLIASGVFNMAASLSMPFSALVSSGLYRLSVWAVKDTTVGQFMLRFNADSGANYDSANSYTLTTGGSGVEAGQNISRCSIGRTATDVSAGGIGSGEWTLMVNPGDSTRIYGSGTTTTQDASDGWYGTMASCAYDGAAAITSIQLDSSAGSASGMMQLVRLQ